ncbi:hypothetical protein [Cupriavidus sp. SS-3]|uniref:hypothetical protein n=1 Tax=Cupriavidus sp. SS-3 TaxID=3109596 RepID=UPI002DB6A6FB|nr:hypothetical protein [Cupriavidus sp. SS-3]MEC3764980.1 hypothetical protein [Cupriavidus sp. SS-3]
MSLLTHAYVLDKYGPRLSVAQLSTLLGIAEGTIRNQISTEAFPIKTYVEGGRRFASYQAVAEYLDAMDALARGQQLRAA